MFLCSQIHTCMNMQTSPWKCENVRWKFAGNAIIVHETWLCLAHFSAGGQVQLLGQQTTNSKFRWGGGGRVCARKKNFPVIPYRNCTFLTTFLKKTWKFPNKKASLMLIQYLQRHQLVLNRALFITKKGTFSPLKKLGGGGARVPRVIIYPITLCNCVIVFCARSNWSPRLLRIYLNIVFTCIVVQCWFCLCVFMYSSVRT